MSLYYGIPLLMLASILQSVWVEGLRVLGGRPDLALLLVVAWAVIRGADEGALWGFVAGVFCDLLSGSSFGLWTVMLTSVGLLAGQPWVQALGPTLVRLALMSGLGTVLAHLGLTTMMSFVGQALAAPVSRAWIMAGTCSAAADQVGGHKPCARGRL